MSRERLGVRWSGLIEGMAVRMSVKNAWRVHPLLDVDDLIQEGFLVYQHCKSVYPHIDVVPHFTSIFCTAFSRKISNLSRTNSKSNHTSLSSFVDDTDVNLEELVTTLSISGHLNEVDFWLALEEAPSEVLALFDGLRKEELGSKQNVHRIYRMRGGRRETVNERLCRIAGFDAKRTNLRGIVNNWIGASLCIQ